MCTFAIFNLQCMSKIFLELFNTLTKSVTGSRFFELEGGQWRGETTQRPKTAAAAAPVLRHKDRRLFVYSPRFIS